MMSTLFLFIWMASAVMLGQCRTESENLLDLPVRNPGRENGASIQSMSDTLCITYYTIAVLTSIVHAAKEKRNFISGTERGTESIATALCLHACQ